MIEPMRQANLIQQRPRGLERIALAGKFQRQSDVLQRRQATLILVTHDLKLAERCGQVVRMADGRIERELAPA